MEIEDRDYELTSKPLDDKELIREESNERASLKEKKEEIETEEKNQDREIDTLIRFLLYLFSFLLGPLGLGILLGSLFFVHKDREFKEVGRVCIILATVPTLIIIICILFFISLAFILGLGRLFMFM